MNALQIAYRQHVLACALCGTARVLEQLCAFGLELYAEALDGPDDARGHAA